MAAPGSRQATGSGPQARLAGRPGALGHGGGFLRQATAEAAKLEQARPLNDLSFELDVYDGPHFSVYLRNERQCLSLDYAPDGQLLRHRTF